MKIYQIKENIARIEQELKEMHQELASAIEDPAIFSAELSKSRDYAFDSKTLSAEEVLKGCVASLDSYGFCVIDNIIPIEEVPAIREEILEAQKKVRNNLKAIKELIDTEGLDDKELLANDKVSLRLVRQAGRPPKLPNDIVWMPKYARHLANQLITAVAKQKLDDHLRIGQLHPKTITPSSSDDKNDSILEYDLFGLPRLYKESGVDIREWHADWPHDPSAYGSDNPDENLGCIRQPFPDITMGLTMIWYLTNVDENSGGTWVVPGSHQDKRSPRGPSDGIIVSAPLPGEMQIKATAGSVFIQDSRLWHSPPKHNFSTQERVTVINRWYPWWLSIDDYAPGSRYNVVCRPLSHAEYLALPKDLQPLMRHLCPGVPQAIQKPLLERAKAAAIRTQDGYIQLKENPDSISQANAHIRVPVVPSKNRTN